MGLQAHAQTPPPGPSERELQAPLTLGDEKTAQGRPYSEPSGWRALGSIVVVLGLAGGGLWAFRKWGVKHLPGTGGTRLKMEETLAMGDRRHISILRADDEQFLVAFSPQGIQLLAFSPQGIQLLARLDGVSQAPTEDFNTALDRNVNSNVTLDRPMPVKEMEAMIRGDKS